MGVRVKFDVLPEIVRPKLEDLNVTTVSISDLFPKNMVLPNSDALPSQGSGVALDSNKYKWMSWTLNLSLSSIDGVTKFVKNLLVQINIINKQITQLLKIIRFFNSDFKSIAFFLKFLLKQIVKQLKTLVGSLSSSGVYVSFILPSTDRSAPQYSIPIHGGFQEFITRVNSVCLNSKDPDAPKFNNKADRVGGFIIGMIGGTEDPDFLGNLVHNFGVLSQFFSISNPIPNPPKSFKAVAGEYKDKNAGGALAPGVLLSWEAPDSPVSDYWVYRRTDNVGTPETVLVGGAKLTIKTSGFLGSELVIVKSIFGKKQYKFYDFKAEVDKTYFYKVYSATGNNFFSDNPLFRAVKSPVSTQFLSATPKDCLDPILIEQYTSVGINGELVSPLDLTGDWQSFTIRRMLGAPIDDAFKKLEDLADKLGGYVGSASDSMSEYIDFIGKKIEGILDIVNAISDTITEVLNFNLRGTFLVLTLEEAEGGMEGFVQRFNEASRTPPGNSIAPDNPNMKGLGKAGLSSDSGGGIAKYRDQGIMLGIVFLYGFPTINKERLMEIVPAQEVGALEAKLKQTQVAVQLFLSMLGLNKG